MRTTKDNLCRHVVSFRINEQERKVLEKWSLDSGMKVSTVMRGILGHYQESSAKALFVEAAK